MVGALAAAAAGERRPDGDSRHRNQHARYDHGNGQFREDRVKRKTGGAADEEGRHDRSADESRGEADGDGEDLAEDDSDEQRRGELRLVLDREGEL